MPVPPRANSETQSGLSPRESPPLSRPLHIVVLNYRDVTHPEAGGAEVYLQEIFNRIGEHGHQVTLVCAGHSGAPRETRLGNVRIQRVATQGVINIAAPVAALRLARREPVDVFVESLCKLPFLMPAFTRIPVLPVVLHLFGHTVFRELNVALASYVWLYEKLIPPIYRGLPFVALSDSTAQDLRRRGAGASRRAAAGLRRTAQALQRPRHCLAGLRACAASGACCPARARWQGRRPA